MITYIKLSITTDGDQTMDQRELFYVAQISEAALQGNLDQCAAYVRDLAEHLDAAEATEAATRLRGILEGRKLHPAKVSRHVGPAAGAPRIPVDAESALDVADWEVVDRESVNLVLSKENAAATQQFIKYVHESDKLLAAGVPAMPSMLIYGPPGCGKTYAARYIAGELGLPLITARSDALISSFLGSTSKNVRKLFDFAQSVPCVLFLDEFDSIAKKRDDSRELGELKRVVISLLQNIDALDGEHVLIAATNHDHLLDPAIWRRFAYKLHLELPDEDARTTMLNNFFGAYLPPGAGILSRIAEGLSGAEIELASRECIRSAVIRDKNVKFADVAVALLQATDPIIIESRADLIIHLDKTESFSRTEIAKMVDVSQPYVTKVLNKERSRG